MGDQQTVQDTLAEGRGKRPGSNDPVPGLVLIFTQGRPECVILPLEDGHLVIGRDDLPSGLSVDPRMSRSHAEVRFDGRRFRVRDLGSSNGTFVDGREVHGQSEGEHLRLLRAGTSLFLLCADVRPFQSWGITRVDGMVLGPGLATAWRAIARYARAGSNLFLRGESGAGKERAVQAFHSLGLRSQQPLVPVNCSAIPEGMAERLFFGTRRGAYSGAAADAKGYIQAAEGGILFLDEVAELDLTIQAKLLRVLESKEVLPLGETRPQRIDFQVCAATHKDLHAEVARGRFRLDLYFRLARPEVRLPPLRERIEEIPWLIDLAVEQVIGQTPQACRTMDGEPLAPGTPGVKAGAARPRTAPLVIHTSFVEACLHRAWPGNVRELLVEVRSAAHEAVTQGSHCLDDTHLASRAGLGFDEELAEEGRGRASRTTAADGRAASRMPDREALEAILRKHEGNVSGAARALGVHRTQLRRWLARQGVEAGNYGPEPAGPRPAR